MDGPEDITPPRKRVKLEAFSMDGIKENSDASSREQLMLQRQKDQNMESIETIEHERIDAQVSREADVGILEYVSPGAPGFMGIFKKRYTDFIVNEILPTGEVVHLTHLKSQKAKISFRRGGTEKTSSAPNSYQEGNDHELGLGANPEVNAQTVSEQVNEAYSLGDGQGEDIQASSDVDQIKSKDEQDRKAETAALAKWEESRDKSEIQVTADDHSELRRYFDDATIAEIVRLFNKVINDPHRSRSQYGFVYSKPVTDRELRKEAHEAIKRVFRFRLESSTDGKGVITIVAADFGTTTGQRGGGGQSGYSRPARGRGGRGGRGRDGWVVRKQEMGGKKSQHEIFQELGGDYTHFTLYKENKDTLEVISFIARSLKMRPNAFQFAGNKDRRAVTTQRASVYRIFPERLAGLNKMLRNARVGDFESKRAKLELGELLGNEFCITLRDCGFEGAEMMDSEARMHAITERVRIGLQGLCEQGFINYYGLQRFGSFATRTDQIGMKLLQGDLKGAVDSILEFSPAALAAANDPASSEAIPKEDKERATALNLFRETGKSRPALDILPRKFSAEISLVRWLGEENRSRDYRNALGSITRNLRMIYAHAYQSLIWNLAASYRWKTWGARVLEGDLVLDAEHKDKPHPQIDVEVDQEGEAIVRPGQEDRAITADERHTRARPLSAEEAASGQYTIFDVVLPTPGFDILYPAHMISFYKETMGSERYGQLDPCNMSRGWKDISLSGSYRKILAKPFEGYASEVRVYEEEDEQLAVTDLQVLEARQRDNAKRTKDEQKTTPQPINGSSQREGREELGDSTHVTTDAVTAAKFQPPGEGLGNSKERTDNATKGDAESEDTTHVSAPAAQPDSASSENPPPKRIGIILNFKLGTSQYATMALRELMKRGGAKEHKPDYSAGRAMDS